MVVLSTFLFAAAAFASPLAERAAGTASVNLGSNTGTPQHLASGFIYGIPDTQGQIPDNYYTDIGFRYGRAGGAQVPAPGRGWIWGLTEYKNRFASGLANYKTTRKYGGEFIWLIHDTWGADGKQNSSAAYPGDNGDWSSWDDYLTHWIADIKANDATAGLVIDIWNEPDETGFWNRPQAQWIQLWGRTWHRLTKDLPGVLLSGPTLAHAPSTSNTWWTNWASFVKTNASIPDQYVWHMEGGSGDMQTTTATLKTILNTYGLPTKPVNINEYGIWKEQFPTGGAWWIAQLERVNALGLRGNWLSSWSLHDFMAGLTGKPNAGTSKYSETGTGYWPTGEWQVYKYYAKSMTGYRVATTPTADFTGDVYATVDSSTKTVRILVGARTSTGTWNVELTSLSSLGLATSGTISITTYEFDGNASNHYQEEDGTVNLGAVAHTYSGNTLTFPIYQTDLVTTWAFEFTY